MNKIDLHEKKILIVSKEELEELERALVGRECWLSDRIEGHNTTIRKWHETGINEERLPGIRVLKADLALYEERLKRVTKLTDVISQLRQGKAMIEG